MPFTALKLFSVASHHLSDTVWAPLFGIPLVFEIPKLIPKIINKEKNKN